MKKYVNIIMGVFVLIILISCIKNSGALNKNRPDKSNLTSENISKTNHNENICDTKNNEACYPPFIMIDKKLYKSTSYVNSSVKCGTADGKIKSTVPITQLPKKNEEANFGNDYEYQFTDKEGYINVRIDDKWIIFNDLNIDKKNKIPKYVANFKAKIINFSDDKLLVKIIKIPDNFKYIFKNKKISEIKPISLDINNLILDRNQKKLTTEKLKNKKVKVYFDGTITGDEDLMSYPINLGEIYRIKMCKK